MGPAAGANSLPESTNWMHPLAEDMIRMGYAQVQPRSPALRAVASCHGALWRAALSGRGEMDVLRSELSRLSALAGVSEAAVEWVNRQVMAELLDMVAKRYMRSPRETSRLSFAVARAGCRIAQARPFGPQEPARNSATAAKKAGAVA